MAFHDEFHGKDSKLVLMMKMAMMLLMVAILVMKSHKNDTSGQAIRSFTLTR